MIIIDDLLANIAHVDSTFLIIIFLVFIVIAYKIFKMVMKAAIVGIISASFPFLLSYVGIATVPITLSSVIWFGMAGIAIFFIYSAINGFLRIIGFIFSPFSKKKDKEKVIIKEVVKEKEDKKKEH